MKQKFPKWENIFIPIVILYYAENRSNADMVELKEYLD